MRPLVPTVVAIVCLQALLATATRAQSSAPRSVIVVAVAPAARELDVPSLRAAIGAELQADAVGEDDARAASARGRFDVSVDRVARELVVSYSGGAEPLVRRAVLPADARAEARAVVALAGNLGRDEAGELAAELRRAAPAHEAEPQRVVRSDPEVAQASEDLDRMGNVLSRYAGNHRVELTVLGWISPEAS
jgi:prolyl-tRNA editing enzyme YbaK/EbsC (Cys-tRNA(Pro) deacylase)